MTDQTKDLGIVPVESINQFAAMVQHWHTNRIKQLNHLLTMPASMDAAIQIGEEEITLTEDKMVGFKAGIQYAIALIGELPFVAELEDAPVTAPATPDTSNEQG